MTEKDYAFEPQSKVLSPRDINSAADAKSYAKTLSSQNVYIKFQK